MNPPTQPGTILYAEDEPTDAYFFERAFKQAALPHRLELVPDGQAAVDYLSGTGRFSDCLPHVLPCLILLDINMPRLSGLEVLEWVRQQPHLHQLPVLILTSSSHPADLRKAHQLGANDYLVKPSDPTALVELISTIRARWLPPALQ